MKIYVLSLIHVILITDFPFFLGGPVIYQKDHALVGIISYLNYGIDEDSQATIIFAQVCSKISYYFDWISQITRIELPKC